MAQTIKLKRSGTQNAVPSTSQLALGEVALNTYDGKMYIKKSVGGTESIVEIGGDATSSSGLDFTGNLNLADNVRIVIGDGDDLQIYHDGSNSYIVENGTGDLFLGATNLRLTNGNASSTYLQGIDGGAVDIRYNNSVKLATTSTGIDVTGTVTVGDSSSNADLILSEGYTNTDARIRNSNGILEIDADLNNEYANSSMIFAVDGVDKLKINNNGDISFYEDTGTTAKFFWDASAESLRVPISLYDNSITAFPSQGYAAVYSTGALGSAPFNEAGHLVLQARSSGALRDILFATGNGATERMRINSSGYVGIGTTNPAAQLHVKSAGNGEIEVERTSGALINLQAQSAAGYIGTDSNHLFGLKANGTVRLKISTGGAISFNDAFTFPTADGSANQVLKTDGSGNVSWATEAAVSANTSISDTDGDTKIQVEESADEDKIRFDTAGVQRMVIDSNGVGIGEESIDANLHISDTNPNLKFEITGAGKWTMGMPAGQTYLAFDEANDALNTPTMVMTKTTKNVGIGTTAPSQKLHVVGKAFATQGFTTDGAAKSYTWRAIDNSSSSGVRYVKICRITAAQSSRLSIELNGRSEGYGNGSLPAHGRLVGQLNNDDNYDFTYYDYNTGSSEVVTEIGQVDVDTASTDIYVKINGFAEIAAVGVISDGDIYPTTGNTGASQGVASAPTGYTAIIAQKIIMENTAGNVGIGTTSPSQKFTVENNSGIFRINTSTSTYPRIEVGSASGTTAAIINRTTATQNIIFGETSDTGNYSFRGGNVGIGTTSPNVNLNLRRETDGNIFAINRAASATHALYIGISGNDTSFYANNGIYKLGINNPLGTGGEIPFITMSPTNRYTTFTAGNVGIGTSSPSQKLQVAGTILADTALAASTGTTSVGIGAESSITDASSTYKTKLITESNNAKLTTYSYSSYLTLKAGVEAPNYANNWSKIELRDGGPAAGTTAHLKFYTSGDQRMIINDSGNVGIGTDSPIAKLDVNGSLNVKTGSSIALSQDTSSDTAILIPRGTSIRSNTEGAYQRTLLTHLGTTGNGAIQIGQQGTTIITDILMYPGSSGHIRFFPSGAEDIRFTDAGKVGIGTTNPGRKLTVQGGTGDNLPARFIGGANTTHGSIEFQDPTTTADYKVQVGSKGDNLYFQAGGAEKARITSSGTVLVGKTSSASATVGAELRNNGVLIGTTSGIPSLLLNRTTSDGNIVDFRKNNTTVGTVGTSAGHLYVGAGGDTNLLFNDTANNIYPWDAASNDVQNGTVDLGASTAKFKDLYLSGQVNTSTLAVGDGTEGAPSIAFQNDTNTGICRTSSDQLRIVAGGVWRAYFEVSGIHSSSNVYTAAGGEFRNYAGEWHATTGTSGNGFKFTNTADSVDALAITSAGNATFAGTISSGNITTTGYLRGPSTFTIDPAAHGDDTGTVVIAGNLQVDGTTTTINSTTLDVDDINITLGKGALSSNAVSGGGIILEGPSGGGAKIIYDHLQDRWQMNKGLELIGTPLVVGTGTTDVGRVETSSGVFSFTAYTTREFAFGNDTNGEHVRIDANGKVGIGTDSPSYTLTLKDNSANTYIRFENTTTNLGWIGYHGDGDLSFWTNASTRSMNITSSGNVGIGIEAAAAKLQIEDAGIDTTTTSTTATTQVAIDTFAAATFRSARYTIQVTNSTDSTYHLTEVLLIHDGTTPQITEYGTIFTGSAEATFDADISSGNVRLLATPASTDSMTFKVVRHCITV
jgi:hypothetical protein